jgi:hypothetical protein
MVLAIMDDAANRTPRDLLHDSIIWAGSPSLKPPILGMLLRSLEGCWSMYLFHEAPNEPNLWYTEKPPSSCTKRRYAHKRQFAIIFFSSFIEAVVYLFIGPVSQETVCSDDHPSLRERNPLPKSQRNPPTN